MTKIRRTWTKALFSFAMIASLAFVSSPAFAKCQRGDCWGGVAYGPGGAWAYEVNHNSRDVAQRLALSRCPKCTRVLTFYNKCGAYVTGPGGYGWGTSKNKDTAIGRAMSECGKHSRNCKLRVWGCTTR